ncbi:MAG: hypothetical protein WHV61_11665, partial [Burkholderiales bacterium]
LLVIGITSKLIFVLAQSTRGLRALVAEEERRYSSPLESPIDGTAAGGERFRVLPVKKGAGMPFYLRPDASPGARKGLAPGWEPLEFLSHAPIPGP